jgi:hypothetical protein
MSSHSRSGPPDPTPEIIIEEDPAAEPVDPAVLDAAVAGLLFLFTDDNGPQEGRP